MSERKRMSRAKAAADPRREVFRGVSASLWFIDDPLPAEPRPSAQGGALFRREDINAAIERGSTMTPAEREALLRGTFSNGPRNVLTVDTLNAAMEALRNNRVALPQTIAMPPSLYEELRRFGVADRYDDQTDAVAWATGIDWSAAEVRERARLRAAQYEREAPWRARILASIPAPRHITAAELRARVVLPTLRERLGRRP